MKERPILFQGAMVRALLAGTKTQTRRAVKWRGLEPGLNLQFTGLEVQRSGSNWVLAAPTRTSWEYRSVPMPCPYGPPGDRLWVRETFFAFGRWETRFSAKKGRDEWHFVDMTAECGHWYFYAATSEPEHVGSFRRSSVTPMWWKRPAIHMPRVASRILLDVAGVRVERVQAISEADAQAEGVQGEPCDHARRSCAEIGCRGPSATSAYRPLWEQINGAGSWDANPWAWVIEFRMVQPQ